MIWWMAAAWAGEPVDVRGLWVADTAAEAYRPTRLTWPGAGEGWDVGILSDAARHPLQELTLSGEPAPVVDLIASAHLYSGVTWRNRRYSLAMPLTAYGQDAGGGFAGLGDLQLSVIQPIRSAERGKIGLALNVSGWVPTGDTDDWSGSPGFGAGALASIGQELGRVGWVANAGVRFGQSAQARNLFSGAGPVGGVEGHLRVFDDVVLGIEAVSQGVTGFGSVPLELGGSARYRHPTGGFASVGFAHGLGSGVGASAGRLMLSVGYGGGRKVDVPDPDTVIVPVMVSQHRSEIRVETPVAELVENKIVLYQQIFFAEASAELLEESEPVLDAILEVVSSHEEATHLLIEGHTNSRGSRTYNQRLSDERAASVADWLVAHGFMANMIITRGFGEERPVVEDTHPDAMVINRRVEFTVLSAEIDPDRVPDASEIPTAVRQGEP